MSKFRDLHNMRITDLFEIDEGFIKNNYGSLANYISKCFELDENTESYNYYEDPTSREELRKTYIFRVRQTSNL